MHVYSNPEDFPRQQTPSQLAYSKILNHQAEGERRSKHQIKVSQMHLNQMYQEKQRQSFPFGKERNKIANYVVDQLAKDQQNSQILEKFRLQAIQNRNQKLMPHYGATPYLTESMLPGASVDPTRLVQKIIPPPTNYIPIRNPSVGGSLVRKSKTLIHGDQEKRSIGVGTQDIYLINSSRKRREMRKKKQLIDIEEDEEESFEKIKRMLNNINSKIKKNTSTLSDSMQREDPIHKANFFKAPKRRMITYETEQGEKRKPRVEYSMNRMKTEGKVEEMGEVKKHLRLLKKRKRERLYNLYGQGKK